MKRGHPIRPADLGDAAYNGISLGLPKWMVKLSWLKFMKAFSIDSIDGRVRGWNIRAIDDGINNPWRPKLRSGRPITFGHFDVTTLDNWRGMTQGVVLDYSRHGRGGNGLLNGLRDPLVSLQADSTQQLLGMSYIKLGTFGVPTPSYFLLERGPPLDEVCPLPDSVYKDI